MAKLDFIFPQVSRDLNRLLELTAEIATLQERMMWLSIVNESFNQEKNLKVSKKIAELNIERSVILNKYEL